MHYVATGNADFGFIALSQALTVTGSYWRVPSELHRPIQQQAIVVTHSQAADDFVTFLKSEPVQKILQASGYSAP
jgi:molybdate transport system substrate-binding protein